MTVVGEVGVVLNTLIPFPQMKKRFTIPTKAQPLQANRLTRAAKTCFVRPVRTNSRITITITAAIVRAESASAPSIQAVEVAMEVRDKALRFA